MPAQPELATLLGTQNADRVNITGGTIAGTTLTTQTITSPTISGPTISGTTTFNGATSGTTTLVPAAISGSSALTLPAVTGTVSSTTGTNLDVVDVYQSSGAVTANNTTTYAIVTGLSGTVVVGTYRYRAVLPSTVANGTGGIKYAFALTTTVLSALEATGIGYTASAVAVQHTTTATTLANQFSQAAVVIMTILEGTFTVSTGGTIAIHMAQNTADASNTVTLVGASFELCRIA